ncbi:hypothetical protein SDC9_35688 [bioreactor metagenome]|uniref:Uncharacterized protein n=1 Tax=bioreactor metagenome TaxID=1076179 RepID=A0A644VE69_9ZZZZ
MIMIENNILVHRRQFTADNIRHGLNISFMFFPEFRKNYFIGNIEFSNRCPLGNKNVKN